jgi:hypothetical protein
MANNCSIQASRPISIPLEGWASTVIQQSCYTALIPSNYLTNYTICLTNKQERLDLI